MSTHLLIHSQRFEESFSDVCLFLPMATCLQVSFDATAIGNRRGPPYANPSSSSPANFEVPSSTPGRPSNRKYNSSHTYNYEPENLTLFRFYLPSWKRAFSSSTLQHFPWYFLFSPIRSSPQLSASALLRVSGLRLPRSGLQSVIQFLPGRHWVARSFLHASSDVL